MATDQDIFPPPYQPDPGAEEILVPMPRTACRIPHLGHTLLFLLIVGVILFLTEGATFGIVMGLHLFGKETPAQLLKEPRIIIPSMALSYVIAGAVVWAVFTVLWRRPFLEGIRWNFSAVRRHYYLLPAIGVGLSVAVQLLSNFLPIPKSLPIDDFFRIPADVWMVAIFGTFLAPLFEELAFRGFLLPSLATASDWLTRRPARHETPIPETQINDTQIDEHWALSSVTVSCIITSIAFALLHADQLAHAWAPLCVLFAVSMVLCVVRLRTQSLAASTVVHATYNATIFVLLFFISNGFRHLDKINH